MAANKSQQDPFLAAIEAKIAAWKTVVESYRLAVSLDGPLSEAGGAPALAAQARNAGPTDLPVGVFRDKGLKEAIPIYLRAGRRKQTNKEIATGLQAGGFPTTSENFEATVGTALYRLKNDGVVLRFSDGWDLAESYPDSLRSRLGKETAPRKAKAKRRSRKQPKAKGQLTLAQIGDTDLKAVG
jgi:hypothetical protein